MPNGELDTFNAVLDQAAMILILMASNKWVLIYAPIALTVLSAGICYFVARKRQANKVLWLVMGAAFGPLAIPFVFFAKPKPPATTTT